MKQDIDSKGKVARYFFESIAELGRWIDETPATWTLRNSVTDKPEHSWDLNCGYKGAVRMAKQGWPEGAERARQSLAAMVPVAYERSKVNDFYGERPNVPRHCAGAPNAMIRKRKQATHNSAPVVSLVVPLCANAVTRAEPMSNFGIGMARLVHKYEHKGTRCEVLATCSLKVSGWALHFVFRVKYADQPLDLSVLAFAIGHPAMFRRLCFALIERSPARQTVSYGTASRTALADILNCPRNAVIINGIIDANTVAKTPELAAEYIEDQAREAFDNRRQAA